MLDEDIECVREAVRQFDVVPESVDDKHDDTVTVEDRLEDEESQLLTLKVPDIVCEPEGQDDTDKLAVSLGVEEEQLDTLLETV